MHEKNKKVFFSILIFRQMIWKFILYGYFKPFPDSINILIENNIANQGVKNKGLLNIETINLRDFTCWKIIIKK